MNNKRKFRALLNKDFKFINNSKFNIYNLNIEPNRTVNIITNIIEYKGNFKTEYRFIAAATAINIYSIGIKRIRTRVRRK